MSTTKKKTPNYSGDNNPNYKHGGKGTRLYRIWKEMKTRCYNKNRANYSGYGGRGITVCPSWRKSFVAFRDDMYASYKEHCKKFGEINTSIDRINNNKGYSPKNCRWATRVEQRHNTRQHRNARLITYKGQTMLMTHWAKKLNLGPGNLWHKLNRGISIDEIISNNKSYDNAVHVSGSEGASEGAV